MRVEGYGPPLSPENRLPEILIRLSRLYRKKCQFDHLHDDFRQFYNAGLTYAAFPFFLHLEVAR